MLADNLYQNIYNSECDCNQQILEIMQRFHGKLRVFSFKLVLKS